MKRLLLLCVALTALSSCSGSQSQIQALERENTALRAERDALKAQLGMVAVGAAQAQDGAIREAAAAYARRCQMALEIARIDSPDMTIPREINGKSCADGALGENAVEQGMGIASSVIKLDDAGDHYTVEVVDTTGQMTTKEF